MNPVLGRKDSYRYGLARSWIGAVPAPLLFFSIFRDRRFGGKTSNST